MNNRLKSVVFRVEYNQDQPAKPKGRGKAKDYNFFAKYPSLLKAKEAIDSGVDQNFWVRSVKRSTKEGDKIYFTRILKPVAAEKPPKRPVGRPRKV